MSTDENPAVPHASPADHGPRPLPLDSDIEVSETPDGSPRPLHLRWRYIFLVFAGGAVGTASRYLLGEVIPDWGGLPVGTIATNILGAFALGVLLEALARRGPDAGTRRTLRLVIGTGFLGGFTTYSALAVGTNALIQDGDPWGGVLYALATLIFGGCASVAGIFVAAKHHRYRHPQAYAREPAPSERSLP